MRESQPATALMPRDHLGCPREHLNIDQTISNEKITFLRKSADRAPTEQVKTAASHNGYLIGLSAAAGHQRRIFHEHHATVHDFDENSVYIRSFTDDYRADLRGSFDFMLMQMSDADLAALADEADLRHVRGLDCMIQQPDPVLGSLLRALFCCMDGEENRSALFVDQISVAIGVHLLQRYGHAPQISTIARRKLSTKAQKDITSLMISRLNGQLSIEELARSCNLSTSAFLQAFRDTLGKTPQQWLTHLRIEKSMHLMLNSPLSLKDVATQCGFSDQSHFTRVFSRITGATPAYWKRTRQS